MNRNSAPFVVVLFLTVALAGVTLAFVEGTLGIVAAAGRRAPVSVGRESSSCSLLPGLRRPRTPLPLHGSAQSVTAPLERR